MNQLQQHANKYYRWGFSLIPLQAGDKSPALPSWKEYQTEHATPAQLAQWFGGDTDTNIGIVCGAVSGNLVVLDFDDSTLFQDFLVKWKMKYGQDLQDMTTVVKTGGGRHVYLRMQELPQSYHPTGDDRKHVPDIQSEGCYVVAAPSLHPSMATYEISTTHDLLFQVANLQEACVEFERPRRDNGKSSNPVGWVEIAMQGCNEGARDNTATKLAGYYRNLLKRPITEQILYQWDERNTPPLGVEAITKCVASAYKYEDKMEPKKSPVKTLSKEQIQSIAGSGWLMDYINWASRYTSAPLTFHLCVGLSLLSSSMGNGVYCRAWGRDMYSNLWLVMLAPSGFYHKTTAIRKGTQILKGALPGKIYIDEWSREKLLELMENNPAGLFEWDEFGNALDMISKEYMSGTKAMFTKLFDSGEDYERETFKGTSAVIKSPAPNIIGGTTIAEFRDKVKDGDLQRGFMSRFLFITGLEKESEKNHDVEYQPKTEEHLRERLKHLSRASLLVNFSSIRDLISIWREDHEESSENINPNVMGFIARLETYLLKLCMVLAASDSPRIEVNEDVFARAALLLDAIKESVLTTITDIHTGHDAKALRQMRELFGQHCPMPYEKLLNLAHIRTKRFNEFYLTLKDTGEVRSEVIEGKEIIHYKEV